MLMARPIYRDGPYNDQGDAAGCAKPLTPELSVHPYVGWPPLFFLDIRLLVITLHHRHGDREEHKRQSQLAFAPGQQRLF